MDDEQRELRPTSEVICRGLGDAAVLVDLTTNQIFELNRTGHRIWELLVEGLDRQAIGDRLQQEFSVERDQLDREIEELLKTLRAERLIVEQ